MAREFQIGTLPLTKEFCFRERQLPKGDAMQDAAQYRIYAQECRKLARTLKAEHRDTLLRIADAWEKCANDIEGTETIDGARPDKPA